MPGNKITWSSCFPKMLRTPVERAHTAGFHSLLGRMYLSALFWVPQQPIKMHAFLIQLMLLSTALPKVITTTTAKMVGPETAIFWSCSHLLSNSDSKRKINATPKNKQTNWNVTWYFCEDSWSNRKGELHCGSKKMNPLWAAPSGSLRHRWWSHTTLPLHKLLHSSASSSKLSLLSSLE